MDAASDAFQVEALERQGRFHLTALGEMKSMSKVKPSLHTLSLGLHFSLPDDTGYNNHDPIRRAALGCYY